MSVKAEKDLLDKLTLDDLGKKDREIAEVIGLDALKALSEHFGGNPLYIPMKDQLIKNLKYASIHREYDGGNIRHLSTKYGVSEATVYNIVRDRLVTKKHGNVLGQTSFADMGWGAG